MERFPNELDLQNQLGKQLIDHLTKTMGFSQKEVVDAAIGDGCQLSKKDLSFLGNGNMPVTKKRANMKEKIYGILKAFHLNFEQSGDDFFFHHLDQSEKKKTYSDGVMYLYHFWNPYHHRLARHLFVIDWRSRRVSMHFYNTYENQFYGEVWQGKVETNEQSTHLSIQFQNKNEHLNSTILLYLGHAQPASLGWMHGAFVGAHLMDGRLLGGRVMLEKLPVRVTNGVVSDEKILEERLQQFNFPYSEYLGAYLNGYFDQIEPKTLANPKIDFDNLMPSVKLLAKYVGDYELYSASSDGKALLCYPLRIEASGRVTIKSMDSVDSIYSGHTFIDGQNTSLLIIRLNNFGNTLTHFSQHIYKVKPLDASFKHLFGLSTTITSGGMPKCTRLVLRKSTTPFDKMRRELGEAGSEQWVRFEERLKGITSYMTGEGVTMTCDLQPDAPLV